MSETIELSRAFPNELQMFICLTYIHTQLGCIGFIRYITVRTYLHMELIWIVWISRYLRLQMLYVILAWCHWSKKTDASWRIDSHNPIVMSILSADLQNWNKHLDVDSFQRSWDSGRKRDNEWGSRLPIFHYRRWKPGKGVVHLTGKPGKKLTERFVVGNWRRKRTG